MIAFFIIPLSIFSVWYIKDKCKSMKKKEEEKNNLDSEYIWIHIKKDNE